jgi:hypothetical protein
MNSQILLYIVQNLAVAGFTHESTMRRLTILLTSMLGIALLAAGCGGGDSETDWTAVDVDHLVFQSHELPGVRQVGEPFPEPCGPVSVLEEGGGRAARSERFILRDGEAVEAAAIFRSERAARSAYRALNRPERLRCIAKAITSFSPQLTIGLEQPEPMDVADEATVTRYRLLEPASQQRGYSNVISLRVGRCTASILVAAKHDAIERLTQSTSTIAAGLLSASCR